MGNYNPYRYRGYRYDSEIGFYYLQSRYYDPEIGRFINADDAEFINASGTVLGCNLYAYCENNTVMREDANGEMALEAGVLTYVGGTNVWNPIGWVAIGIAGVVAVVALVTTADNTSQSIPSTLEQSKSISIPDSVSKSISKSVSKTKKKIKNKKVRNTYWVAVYVDYGDGIGTFVPANNISFSKAMSYVRNGGSVFASSRIKAYQLAKAVGGAAPERDPAHGGLGYWKHYHAVRGGKRIGGHVFYVV